MQPYAPRQISFQGLRHPGAWRLKLYSVVYGPGSLDWSGFEPGLIMAEAGLPSPDWDRGRPGVGLIIAHQGRAAAYIILGWWDRENELPLRIFVRSPGGWEPAKDGESVCVWDLEILWAEREAYVGTMLTSAGADVSGYLERNIQGTPSRLPIIASD